ncbi:MAG TPA: PrsW family glutamic-type intramembrane protease [Thermoplasmata archaeon]|nr:PrsW family glutamic-type intramembrane protease [Thermoplasmata archaeon]
MTDFGAGIDLVILVVAALLPAIIYLAWVRKSERYQREAWGTLLGSFVYGAIVATFTAIFLESIVLAAGNAIAPHLPGPEFIFLNSSSSAGLFFLVLVVAPFIEEGLKASGVTRVGPKLRVLGDGPVFGAAVGLGFGFFETFLYGVSYFLVGGLALALGVVIERSLSSILLHGSTTGMFGYGYAAGRLRGVKGAAGRYYLLAVLMHASFNALVSLGLVLSFFGFGSSLQADADLIGLGAGILFAFLAIEHVRRLITCYDTLAAATAHPRFPPPKVRPVPVPGRR